ncbi:hypothetical protein UlMin_005218 [Ulmus minor]
MGALVLNWWDAINESTHWQDDIFYTLCAAYALVSSIAMVQLIRIELRVPEYGWTTHKVFFLMNFLVNGVRAIVFGFHKQVFLLNPKVLTLVLLDLPGLLFFTTYTLLVLFWAEIYHQVRTSLLIHCLIIDIKNLPTNKVCIWIYLWINDNTVVEFVGKIFIADHSFSQIITFSPLFNPIVSFLAALGFLLYGGSSLFHYCSKFFVCVAFDCLSIYVLVILKEL